MAVILSKVRFIFLACNISAVYIALGLLLSLQPPFFPSEAEKKGATPGEYGFVFGIANLSLFFFSPIFGKFGAKIGAKTCFNIGAVLQGVSGFLFAFLPFLNGVGAFLGLSYLLRFLEGMGTAMAWSAAVGILMKIFPNKVAKVMSWTQTCFGLGYMLGPAVGAALYEVGGFMLPFLIVGSFSTILSLLLVVSIPKLSTDDETETESSLNGSGQQSNGHVPHNCENGHVPSESEPLLRSNSRPQLGFRSLFSSMRLLLPFVDLFTALNGTGMLESMLEPHLRSVGASTIDVGVTFLIFGCAYMFGNLIFGTILDKISRPIYFSILGNCFFLVTFLLIGPSPIMPVKPSLGLILGMMVLAGAAYSSLVLSSFSRAQKRVLEMGYDDDLHTYVMITGVWMSAFALGNFVGPTVGGIIVQTAGFPKATLMFVAIYFTMIVVDFFQLFTLNAVAAEIPQAYERID